MIFQISSVFVGLLAAVDGFSSTGRAAFMPRSATSLNVGSRVDRDTTTSTSTTGEGFVHLNKLDHHDLYYVKSVFDINDDQLGQEGPIHERVRAFSMTNDKGVKVKAMARGANMVELSMDGTNYVWENKEGGCYYGADQNAFPLNRGLILNGGIRYAAGCAEHGLYYDFEWDHSFEESEDGKRKSIIFTVTDNQANRDLVAEAKYLEDAEYVDYPNLSKGFSVGQFNAVGGPEDVPLNKYLVSDMVYKYNITLCEGEEFVRLHMSVENPTDKASFAEAWLPMTFPIDTSSRILSQQKMRWRRDTWCYDTITPNMVPWDSYTDQFEKPLDWPGSGIFYDFPYKDGAYHGVTLPESGKGCVYVAPEETAHWTKMWSWGGQEYFNRDTQLGILNGTIPGDPNGAALAVGRPVSEYYEPWSSGTNFAFFQTNEFKPQTKYSWEVAVLPITQDLDKGKSTEDLNKVVQDKIKDCTTLSTLQEVVEQPLKEPKLSP